MAYTNDIDYRTRRVVVGTDTCITSFNRDPLRWVVRKRAFAEAETQNVDPDYSNIVNLQNDLEDLAQRAGIEVNTLFFDSPWQDLPFYNRYSPYTSSPDKATIKVRARGQTQDIAMDPSSLVFYLAKRQAQVIRLYTLKENREQMANAS